MMRIEWRDTWINTLIDAGISLKIARETYQVLYGQDGPDLGKNAVQEAKATLRKLKAEQDYPAERTR